MVKKIYKWKRMLIRPLGRPNNRWVNDIKIYEENVIKNKLAASRIAIIGNFILGRPKHSTIEVVTPKEEEEEESNYSCLVFIGLKPRRHKKYRSDT
jgi:hypothetical protein